MARNVDNNQIATNHIKVYKSISACIPSLLKKAQLIVTCKQSVSDSELQSLLNKVNIAILNHFFILQEQDSLEAIGTHKKIRGLANTIQILENIERIFLNELNLNRIMANHLNM